MGAGQSKYKAANANPSGFDQAGYPIGYVSGVNEYQAGVATLAIGGVLGGGGALLALIAGASQRAGQGEAMVVPVFSLVGAGVRLRGTF